MGVKKAMNMMDLTREAYVAIVDNDHRFLGVVMHSDIVSFLEKPPHKMHTGDFHGEKVHRDRSISSLARMPETLTREAKLKDAVDLMVRLKVPMVYILDEEGLAGSISEVDILEVLMRGRQEEGPFIQIAGVDDAKLMDAGELNDAVLKGVSKIEKKFKVTAATVRIRHHHHDTDDDKYTVNVKLTTPHLVIAREAYDWDLRVAIQTAFSNIEKSLKKDLGKKRNR
jgi:CBS domain-containing protein/ribosome-associated translation inhibitor RaiA